MNDKVKVVIIVLIIIVGIIFIVNRNKQKENEENNGDSSSSSSRSLKVEKEFIDDLNRGSEDFYVDGITIESPEQIEREADKSIGIPIERPIEAETVNKR